MASWCALLMTAAALLHSFSLMCRRLPPDRRPAWYPRTRLQQTAVDLLWLSLFLAALSLAFRLTPRLGITAAAVYFLLLPFLIQPAMARLLGFRSLRHYLDEIDRS